MQGILLEGTARVSSFKSLLGYRRHKLPWKRLEGLIVASIQHAEQKFTFLQAGCCTISHISEIVLFCFITLFSFYSYMMNCNDLNNCTNIHICVLIQHYLPFHIHPWCCKTLASLALHWNSTSPIWPPMDATRKVSPMVVTR